ncbi:acyl-CoA dehydrogenase [Altererythrobacter atlanticus]|uniref:Acyl-CoA dehydrogenase n=1 Tax=Croceibacterium atlanticum TaxID=1267766 RepID=A0A0F7KYP0_9SPHN|nr:acyl-CoA dehydrogenase family protein [Croceibacterium atlanticum]AKH44366.1 Acyl-CoA dehydrogenase [Croceibacterium atlanticum]MBB5733917.1 acyl-CoA dehydrogenase [Croceibacterium atlanticum]
MDFELPDEIKDFCEATRSIVNDLLPLERDFVESGKVPPIVRETLVENGYFGMALPEEYGGLGLGALAQAAVQIELARLPPQFWTEIRPLMGPGAKNIAYHCSEAQKELLIPGMASGEIPVAFALTEPGSGSDPGSMRTTATRNADGWVINGSKTYISNGKNAKYVTVYAYTDKSAGPRGGISAFLMDADTPGFAVTGVIELMGTSPAVYELTFDQCQVGPDALIGEEGRGFHYALECLNEGRMNVGATAVGMGEYALELATEEAKVRPAFGSVIADFQAIRHYLAGMATDMRAARLILLDAAWRYDQGEKRRELAAMAKLFATEAGSRTVDTALQIFGGAGYCKGYAIERLYRDIRITRIYEGSSEIQKNTIARELLR